MFKMYCVLSVILTVNFVMVFIVTRNTSYVWKMDKTKDIDEIIKSVEELKKKIKIHDEILNKTTFNKTSEAKDSFTEPEVEKNKCSCVTPDEIKKILNKLKKIKVQPRGKNLNKSEADVNDDIESSNIEVDPEVTMCREDITSKEEKTPEVTMCREDNDPKVTGSTEERTLEVTGSTEDITSKEESDSEVIGSEAGRDSFSFNLDCSFFPTMNYKERINEVNDDDIDKLITAIKDPEDKTLDDEIIDVLKYFEGCLDITPGDINLIFKEIINISLDRTHTRFSKKNCSSVQDWLTKGYLYKIYLRLLKLYFTDNFLLTPEDVVEEDVGEEDLFYDSEFDCDSSDTNYKTILPNDNLILSDVVEQSKGELNGSLDYDSGIEKGSSVSIQVQETILSDIQPMYGEVGNESVGDADKAMVSETENHLEFDTSHQKSNSESLPIDEDDYREAFYLVLSKIKQRTPSWNKNIDELRNIILNAFTTYYIKVRDHLDDKEKDVLFYVFDSFFFTFDSAILGQRLKKAIDLYKQTN